MEQLSKLKIGDEVIWSARLRGGYGYILAVPAKVVGFTAKRIRILAKLRDGGEKCVSVRRINLRPNDFAQ